MIYVIDFAKLVVWLLPFTRRGIVIVSYLQNCIDTSIDFVYGLFLLYRTSTNYNLSITPQVVYLEKMLNDRFDNTTRGIYIVNDNSVEATYIYTKAENNANYTYTRAETNRNTIVLYQQNETAIAVVDFVVHVPNGVSFDEAEMKSLIDYFKLAGKRYTIVID